MPSGTGTTREDATMLSSKKKKILKLAKQYVEMRELGWETYYREMSGLLK